MTISKPEKQAFSPRRRYSLFGMVVGNEKRHAPHPQTPVEGLMTSSRDERRASHQPRAGGKSEDNLGNLEGSERTT